MKDPWANKFRTKLNVRQDVLRKRLAKIGEKRRLRLDDDAGERSIELENQEVVDALENAAQQELTQVSAALIRIDSGEYGICDDCGDAIREDRLLVYPHTEKCIECATLEARGGPYRSFMQNSMNAH